MQIRKRNASLVCRSNATSRKAQPEVAGEEKKETARSLGLSLSARNTIPCLGQVLNLFRADVIEIGLLQLTITWYKIRHAGGQAHYYSRTGTSKQRQVKLHWFSSLCFNVCYAAKCNN